MIVFRVFSLVSLATLALAMCVLGPTGCDSEIDAQAADASSRDAARESRVPDLGPESEEPECTPSAPDGALVPEPYSGRTSPFAVTDDRIEAGRDRFLKSCAGCHGRSGNPGASEGTSGRPAPADLTRVVRPEDYLFWRISAGGGFAPFCSGMPAFAPAFGETARWELVAFVRSLAEPSIVDAGDAAAKD